MEIRDRISVIELRETVPNGQQLNEMKKNPVKKVPSFFQNYCLCLNRKVEPEDVNGWTANKFEAENDLNLNPSTTIIPITIDPNMYVALLFAYILENLSCF